MKKIKLIILIAAYIVISCKKDEPAGINIPANTANTTVKKYDGPFLYGMNMAYKNANWKDEDIADILVGNSQKNIAGMGANSLRPALYENFVEKYGYNIRLDAFSHYKTIGTTNNTIFIGDRPSDAHRERKQYADGLPSESYENLYEPIWDNGENGTPVNDKNHFALYVYKVAQMYGDNVKFWEIKNEPDFTYTAFGNRKAGEEGNWWDNDPKPEHLKNLAAPVQSYIRMLRVSYEVIKQVHPNAYICVGGIGYTSFLDAILRNTDNPDGGKVTNEYPLTGGAWFDCLSYHLYPMYYLRTWTGNDTPGNINGFTYFRNSDAAASMVVEKKEELNNLLKKYGYGMKYPEKEVIITETNIPNRQLGDHIGSQEAQRNFAVKTAVLSQQNNIAGVYIYCPWDNKEPNDASGESYDYMGIYKPIPESPGQTLRPNEEGTAWKTMSTLLQGRKYHADETNKLNLPSTIGGGAFYSSKSKDYVYVLWAKTTEDLSENASINYSFPTTIKNIVYKEWNNKELKINGNTINLKGSPVFITQVK